MKAVLKYVIALQILHKLKDEISQIQQENF